MSLWALEQRNSFLVNRTRQALEGTLILEFKRFQRGNELGIAFAEVRNLIASIHSIDEVGCDTISLDYVETLRSLTRELELKPDPNFSDRRVIASNQYVLNAIDTKLSTAAQAREARERDESNRERIRADTGRPVPPTRIEIQWPSNESLPPDFRIQVTPVEVNFSSTGVGSSVHSLSEFMIPSSEIQFGPARVGILGSSEFIIPSSEITLAQYPVVVDPPTVEPSEQQKEWDKIVHNYPLHWGCCFEKPQMII